MCWRKWSLTRNPLPNVNRCGVAMLIAGHSERERILCFLKQTRLLTRSKLLNMWLHQSFAGETLVPEGRELQLTSWFRPTRNQIAFQGVVLTRLRHSYLMGNLGYSEQVKVAEKLHRTGSGGSLRNNPCMYHPEVYDEATAETTIHIQYGESDLYATVHTKEYFWQTGMSAVPISWWSIIKTRLW